MPAALSWPAPRWGVDSLRGADAIGAEAVGRGGDPVRRASMDGPLNDQEIHVE
jgi:hypothetical protein